MVKRLAHTDGVWRIFRSTTLQIAPYLLMADYDCLSNSKNSAFIRWKTQCNMFEI